jgi:hypothetical protein
MLRDPRRLVIAGALVAATACSTNAPNPFAQRSRTVAPPAGATAIVPSGRWSSQPSAPRELFALDASGGSPTQLTFCNEGATCDILEAIPSRDRHRLMLNRVSNAIEGPSLVFVDLSRSAQATIVTADKRLGGADWSPQDQIIAYSATGDGGLPDLYRVLSDGSDLFQLTLTPAVGERRPRIDPTGREAVFERVEAGQKTGISIFLTRAIQNTMTSGGPGEGALATGELIGSDASPDYGPDSRSIVFRRLTAVGDGRGNWDLLTLRTNDPANLTPVATGPIFRGAPDWGARGILFTEIDLAAREARVVVIQPDGSDRRVLLTQPATTLIGTARWLQETVGN